ncbi:MAG: AAA family ATPase [Leptospiraceae bacterium]|nr:AAA family ATPase [Leptospiraceae bacterium]
MKNSIKGRSEFAGSEIKNKIKLFIPSKEYDSSIKILNSKNFLLITGEPGIGKTMLANMLTYQFLAKNFELIYVTEIKEAEEAYENGKKQIFYFDDFLGAITLDLTSSRNADAAIVNFIERIRKDKQKRLILTCRTTILNQAKEKSDKLNNSNIDIANHEVKIGDYGNLDKAKILYNHIFFSNLTEELKIVFFKNEFYWKVIKHRNYNPRLIQFFTNIEKVNNEKSYETAIINYLDNPEQVWEQSFEIQISHTSQIFLSIMVSLSSFYVIDEYRLKKAYNARLDYEVKNNNFTKTYNNTFEKTVKELQNAFIKRYIRKYENFNSIEYRFLNPSIQDFLVYYFNKKNFEEYFTILKTAVFLNNLKVISQQNLTRVKRYYSQVKITKDY